QKFLAAVLRQFMSQGLLSNSGKLNDFLDLFTHSAFADNMNVNQLLGLATSLQSLSPAQITLATVPTTGAPDTNGNAVLMADQNTQLFTAIINNSTLPSENTVEDDANIVNTDAP